MVDVEGGSTPVKFVAVDIEAADAGWEGNIGEDGEEALV
jgi:hypothetical protein